MAAVWMNLEAQSDAPHSPPVVTRPPPPASFPTNRFMVIGWSVCFPVGIIFGRFSHSFAEFGFFAHRGLQTLGALFAFVGFFVAVSFTEDSGSG